MMWASPLLAVLKARQNKSLGDLNPLPWSITVLNCIGWGAYGMMTRDPYIFFANVGGVIFGMFLVLVSVNLLGKPNLTVSEERNLVALESIVLGGITAWLLILFFLISVLGDGYHDIAVVAVGTVGDVCTLVYYMAPLSTSITIVKTKDASSLFMPMIVINLFNATLWTVYGIFALGAITVWLPNTIGIVLSLVQIVLYFMFKKTVSPIV